MKNAVIQITTYGAANFFGEGQYALHSPPVVPILFAFWKFCGGIQNLSLIHI